MNEVVYYVGMGVKNVKPFSLLHFAYQSYWLRVCMGYMLPMYLMEKLVPRYGLVAVLDGEHGHIIRLLHDPTGNIPFISEATLWQSSTSTTTTTTSLPVRQFLFLGSHSNHFIARSSNI